MCSFVIYTAGHMREREIRGITSSLVEKRNDFRVYEWKFERDLPLSRTRPTRKDTIEVGIREI
jgi:hypothetical protein